MTAAKVKLIRAVNSKIRYYTIALSANLFGDFELEKVYGSVNNKKPTGAIREFFVDANEAKMEFERVLSKKLAKGYVERNNK